MTGHDVILDAFLFLISISVMTTLDTLSDSPILQMRSRRERNWMTY